MSGRVEGNADCGIVAHHPEAALMLSLLHWLSRTQSFPHHLLPQHNHQGSTHGITAQHEAH
eukprot:350179-Chlamydomonas_euryale.AAC.1